MRIVARRCRYSASVVDTNTDAICEEVGQDGVKAILAAMSATGNMPATEAFLAEVQAQGVDSAINTVIAMMNHQHPVASAESTYCASMPTSFIKRCSRETENAHAGRIGDCRK